jgi:hypothetical protein
MKIRMSRRAGSRSARTKIHKFVLSLIVLCMALPATGFASTIKTFSGTITKINGSQIFFAATSAANYSADIANASLIRKNGVVMQFSEFLVGDKVQVVGTLWNDNSISATTIKDLSLYAHTGTYSGKIISINPSGSSFIMQSKTYGSQTITTNNFTAFSKNGGSAAFSDMQLGMTASVKGMWDRTNTKIIATSVDGSFRLIDIYFTGNLSMTGPSSLTVIGNGNVIYGIDITKASLQSKNSKPLTFSEIKPGDALRVWGKHISGSVQITGTEIKDISVTK